MELGAMDGRLSDAEWLQRARTATGIASLEAARLIIVEGVLTRLNLSRRNLESLPSTIRQLTSLTELNLGMNRLASLPESIGDLVLLSELILSGNQLVSLPESIGQLTSLERLDLSSNRLASLPESLGQLKKLKVLDIRGPNQHQLQDIARRLLPRAFLYPYDHHLLDNARNATGISSLERRNLIVENGALVGLSLKGRSSLPERIEHLAWLKELDLSNNKDLVASLLRFIGAPSQLHGRLTRLDLGSNDLHTLPETIGQLANLEMLDLSYNNRLDSLPESFQELKKLKVLDLTGNQQEALLEAARLHVPRAFVHPYDDHLLKLAKRATGIPSLKRSNLTVDKGVLVGLSLKGLGLSSLPENIVDLASLTELDLSSNQLVSLPESIERLSNLERLDLSSNQLGPLPESLGQLKKLKVLDIQGTKQRHQLLADARRLLPRAFLYPYDDHLLKLARDATGIQSLDPMSLTVEKDVLVGLSLKGLGLSSLPENIVDLASLTELDLSSNQLVSLPESIERLSNLERLDLSSNRLGPLPESLGQLKKLKVLDIRGPDQHHQLQVDARRLLPRAFLYPYDDHLLKLARDATGIQSLDPMSLTVEKDVLVGLSLKGQGLTSLLESIGQLTSLTELDLSDNKFTKVRSNFAIFSRKLSINHIDSLPESIGQPTNSERLDLSHNQLASLPKSLGLLKKLKVLDLTGNQEKHLQVDARRLLPRAFLQPYDHLLLENARNATGIIEETGIPSLNPMSLTVENGVLVGLSLNGLGLTSLPESIGQLTSVTELDLSSNDLDTLPESIRQLANLERLDLSSNRLACLPNSFQELKKLKVLDIRGPDQHHQLQVDARRLLPRVFLHPYDDDLLTNAQRATGLQSLDHGNLTLDKGVMVGLSLSGLGLTSLLDVIRFERLTSLTELDISDTQIVSLPEAIGQLTSLTKLNLSHNELGQVWLPESIGGKLNRLTSLNLSSCCPTASTRDPPAALSYCPCPPRTTGASRNKINTSQALVVPKTIEQLTNLETLDLSSNNLEGLPDMGTLDSDKRKSLPDMEKLSKLTRLNLENNKLRGEVPLWLGKLVNLEFLNLSSNPYLGGSLPAMAYKEIRYKGTNINGVLIKQKPVSSFWDYLFIVLHVLIGYLDLVTDVLSIIQFQKQGNKNLMAANIVFLLFNVCVDVYLMSDAWGKVRALLQVQQVVQAFNSLTSGRQTANLVRSKKVDAVCRSVPSIVLQLYGLLTALPSLRSAEGFILILSVVTGVVGSSISLGSLAPRSGLRLFSQRFAVHFCYYFCELTARLLSMSLLFISIGPIAFAVLVPDFVVRLVMSIIYENGNIGARVLTSVLLFGSDGVNDISVLTLMSSSSISSAVLLISLFLINLLNTPDLRALRAAPANPVHAVTALACIALSFKYLFGRLVFDMEPQEAADKYVTRAEATERFLTREEVMDKYVRKEEVKERDDELRALREKTEDLEARMVVMMAEMEAGRAQGQGGGATRV